MYDNEVVANNTGNFAHKGAAVASVPAGSGVVINSNDEVEIFNNRIRDNDTANVIISSAQSTGYYEADKEADGFDPYPESIYIYDNQFEGGGKSPDHLELKALKVLEFGLGGALPDILWDGYYDPTKQVDGEIPEALRICVQIGDAGLVNVDAPGGFKAISTDKTPHDCELPKLPAVVLQGA